MDILAYVNHLANFTCHKSIENKAKFIPTIKTIPIILANIALKKYLPKNKKIRNLSLYINDSLLIFFRKC